jgi:hypothetical protein
MKVAVIERLGEAAFNSIRRRSGELHSASSARLGVVELGIGVGVGVGFGIGISISISIGIDVIAVNHHVLFSIVLFSFFSIAIHLSFFAISNSFMPM